MDRSQAAVKCCLRSERAAWRTSLVVAGTISGLYDGQMPDQVNSEWSGEGGTTKQRDPGWFRSMAQRRDAGMREKEKEGREGEGGGP